MAFRNQNFMVTWSTNLRNLFEGMTLLFQFSKIITRYRRIGYNLNVMRQSACLVFNPIMVDNDAAFLNCTLVGRASDCDSIGIKLFILVGWGRSFVSVCFAHRGPTGVFLLLRVSVGYSAPKDLNRRTAY